jgi:hypothetical protein
MMSELTRLHDEALRLLTVYDEYKDSSDEYLRRKVHIDLDRFLMQHREIAAILLIQGLQDTISKPVVSQKKEPWYKRLFGGDKHVHKKEPAISNDNAHDITT